MTDDRADAHIDDVLEALARPEPPGDHVARVLAQTGPATLSARPADAPSQPVRWAVPVAASLLVAAGLTWTQRDVTLPPVSAGSAESLTARSAGGPSQATDGSEIRPYQPWGALREVDRPVLPPQAYWGMDAFEEWRRLGRAAGDDAPAHRQPATGDRPLTGRRLRHAAANATRLAWSPAPSGLPPIEMEPIEPAPLTLAPLAEPAPIELPAIALEPIVIAPLDQQERP